jgi:DNA-binding transcriptional LysR family regulator
MDRLETRELEYFVAVAEELHFGRAAERLGMAQPPLSRAISRLERRIGVRLLERTSRRVVLTDAGHAFLTDSRRLLEATDAAMRRAQRAGQPGRVVMAVRPGTAAGLIAELVRSAEVDKHDVLFTHDLSAALRSGSADVALLCLDTHDVTGLQVAELTTEAPVALMPRRHLLAGRRTVTVAELAHDANFAPECPPLGLDEIVDRVGLGFLITVVGSGAAERISPEVAAVPVSDLPPTQLALAWLEAPRPAVTAFVSAARATEARRAAEAKRTAPLLQRVQAQVHEGVRVQSQS